MLRNYFPQWFIKSRLKLLIYSGLIMSLISTVLNLSIKNYVQLGAVGSIVIYFGLVYSTLPNTIITCLSLCIIKGFCFSTGHTKNHKDNLKPFRYDSKNWNQFSNSRLDEYSDRWMWIYLHSQYEYICYQFKCSNIDTLYNFEADETGNDFKWLKVVGQR